MAEEEKEKEKEKEPWWKTVPGMITGAAALLTALSGLIAGLHQAGLFKGGADPAAKPAAVQTLAAPKLLAPTNGELVPQPFVAGTWQFKWEEPDRPGEVLQYELIIVRGGTGAVRDLKLEKPGYTLEWKKCSHIRDQDRLGWKWKVRAQDKKGDWSPWSSEYSFDVRQLDQKLFAEKCPEMGKPAEAGKTEAAITPPPLKAPAAPALAAPVLVAPKKGETIPQPYAVPSVAFKWEEPGKAEEVLQYHLMIIRGSGFVVRDIKLEKTGYTMGWKKCATEPETDRHNWKWRVRAQDKNGDWSPWSEASFDIAAFDQKLFAEKCPGVPMPAAPGAGVNAGAPSKPAEFPASMLQFFPGMWKNTNPNTKGVTQMKITRSGDELLVRVWGKCLPADCDWGEVKAEKYLAANARYSLMATFRGEDMVRVLSRDPQDIHVFVQDGKTGKTIHYNLRKVDEAGK